MTTSFKVRALRPEILVIHRQDRQRYDRVALQSAQVVRLCSREYKKYDCSTHKSLCITLTTTRKSYAKYIRRWHFVVLRFTSVPVNHGHSKWSRMQRVQIVYWISIQHRVRSSLSLPHSQCPGVFTIRCDDQVLRSKCMKYLCALLHILCGFSNAKSEWEHNLLLTSDLYFIRYHVRWNCLLIPFRNSQKISHC